MKLNCGPTPEEKFARLKDWHRKFAWLPIRVGSGDCRWLEYVERKGTYRDCGWAGGWMQWDYRSVTR